MLGNEIVYPLSWAVAFEKVSLRGTCRSVWVCWADSLRAVSTSQVAQTHIPSPPRTGNLGPQSWWTPGKKEENLATTFFCSFEVVPNLWVCPANLARCMKHFGESASGFVPDFFFLGGGVGVGAWNRHNVANWRSNLETVNMLAILMGFLGFSSHSHSEALFMLEIPVGDHFLEASGVGGGGGLGEEWGGGGWSPWDSVGMV